MFYELGPFDVVLDVGGNVGEFAERCSIAWPTATIFSFEPLPELAAANRERSDGRWNTIEVACSSRSGNETMRRCRTWPQASTLEEPGSARRRLFGVVDEWETVEVELARLDTFRGLLEGEGRVLLKVDVEGHELEVLRGALHVLELVHVALVECNQVELVRGGPSPDVLDAELRASGLYFAGVHAVQMTPAGDRVAQFDGVWSR